MHKSRNLCENARIWVINENMYLALPSSSLQVNEGENWNFQHAYNQFEAFPKLSDASNRSAEQTYKTVCAIKCENCSLAFGRANQSSFNTARINTS